MSKVATQATQFEKKVKKDLKGRKVCATVEIAQHTVNFMGNKISKGPKSINTETKFPQDLRNLTPSTLLPLFPRSRPPVPAATLFLFAFGAKVALRIQCVLLPKKKTKHSTASDGCGTVPDSL